MFRGNGLSVRLEGASAGDFAETILPLLSVPRTLAELVAALPRASPAELEAHLDDLVVAGALQKWNEGTEPAGGGLLAFAERFGVSAAAAAERLRQARVGIVGLEAHGALLAMTLAACGVGTLALADPYPCAPETAALIPGLPPELLGGKRHDAIGRTLARSTPSVTVACFGADVLLRPDVERLVSASDIVAGCFDRGMTAAHHWLNRAALAHQIPAIYATLEVHEAIVGPMVIPGQTACFLCDRMRRLACEVSFEDAMSPRGVPGWGSAYPDCTAVRCSLPRLARGKRSALEILKRLLGLEPISLAGRVQCGQRPHAGDIDAPGRGTSRLCRVRTRRAAQVPHTGYVGRALWHPAGGRQVEADLVESANRDRACVRPAGGQSRGRPRGTRDVLEAVLGPKVMSSSVRRSPGRLCRVCAIARRCGTTHRGRGVGRALRRGNGEGYSASTWMDRMRWSRDHVRS